MIRDTDESLANFLQAQDAEGETHRERIAGRMILNEGEVVLRTAFPMNFLLS